MATPKNIVATFSYGSCLRVSVVKHPKGFGVTSRFGDGSQPDVFCKLARTESKREAFHIASDAVLNFALSNIDD